MIGQLVFTPKGWGTAAESRLYGLAVLRAEAGLEGFWGERRLRRAGRELRRGGALRVLVPRNFSRWPLLERFGLRPVEPESFVRAQSASLALEALERGGLAPDRATVALRGVRVDHDLARTAAQLCPRVRRLVVDAPRGGEELALWLRREFGIPVMPPQEEGQIALRFQDCPQREETTLDLYGTQPQLAGLTLAAPELAEEDQENLPLLAALWEGGQLGPEDIKIT